MPDAPSNLPFADMPTPKPVAPTPPPVPVLSVPPRPPAPPQATSIPAQPVPPTVPSVRPPVAAPPEDLFADVDRPVPPKAPTVMPVEAPVPPPTSSGVGKTVLMILGGLIVFGGVAGASWYGYEMWKKNMVPVENLVVTPTSTTDSKDLPILPPPAQVPSLTVGDLGVEAVTTSVTIAPLPTPVTQAPSGTSVPLPTDVSAVQPIVPTAPQGGVSSLGTGSQVSSTVTGSIAPVQVISSSDTQVDTDGDGLFDKRETELGTDLLKADTDGDGISDGQEVLTYGTNPLNPDTDGDGFNDGVEMRNGYNPRGTGKCSHPDCRL